jgi:hypothetical protein
MTPCDTPEPSKSLVWVGKEYRELNSCEKDLLNQGKKILKTNGKSEFVLIDNPQARPYVRVGGSNFTPKRKRRNK